MAASLSWSSASQLEFLIQQKYKQTKNIICLHSCLKNVQKSENKIHLFLTQGEFKAIPVKLLSIAPQFRGKLFSNKQVQCEQRQSSRKSERAGCVPSHSQSSEIDSMIILKLFYGPYPDISPAVTMIFSHIKLFKLSWIKS